MSLRYKIDVLAELKKIGYTTTILRNEKILSEGVMTSLRKRANISWDNIDKICRLLKIQPGDLLEWVDDKDK